MKEDYNRKTKTGWIGSQYNYKGNYVERPEEGSGYEIYLRHNEVLIFLSLKQFTELLEMLENYKK